MTNVEKFENTFGFKPDTEFGCETWWNEEYKPNPRIVEILDYLQDFDWYSPYQETIDELRNLLNM